MKSLEIKKSNKILNSILSYVFKIAVLLLFVFSFVGMLNPARISGYSKRSASLVKSAFYFQSYVQDIFEDIEGEESKTVENESTESEESGSYDDFYANFEQMISTTEAFTNESTVSEDDDSLAFGKANKIKASAFSKVWKNYSKKYSSITDVLSKLHLMSIFLFTAVIVALLGVFLSFSSGKLKKAGYIITAAGSVLVIALTLIFIIVKNSLTAGDQLALNCISIKPAVLAFVIFAAISLIVSVVLFILDKEAALEKTVLSEKPFQWTYRILALLLFVLLFIPGANPARITGEISRTVSLFTSGFAYNIYTKNLQRVFVRGWLPEYVIRISYFSSLLACLGILACGVGSCMSIGNNKLKRIAHYTLAGGEVVTFVSLFGIRHAYNLVCANPNVEKVKPLEPACFTLFLILLAIMLFCTAISFIKTPAPEKDEKCHIDAPYQLFLMLLPFLILVFLFSYLPLWGWRYAFFDYNPGDTLSMDKWVGWKWFKAPFENAATRNDILRVLRNTLVMSGLGIAFSWLPMIFAIFLAEIKNTTARKIIQTLTTVPNFISWVLVYAIAFCIFGTDGFISSMMVKSGAWDQGKNMLMGDTLIWLKMWAWGTWKGLGWSAIMYIAAISGIDQQLYEAATVDGAGRFQKIWHITIPELLSTYLVLLILSVSNILSNGMDQYLVFKNPTNQAPIEVLDLYVYNLSFGNTSNSSIPFSTVVSMLKSLVSVVLLFITNRISKLIRGSSIF